MSATTASCGAGDSLATRIVIEPHGTSASPRVSAAGIGTVRYPRIVAKDGEAGEKLAKRTLTALYNERPAWLARAHRRLDEAVCAAYGRPAKMGDPAIRERYFRENREPSCKLPAHHRTAQLS